MKDLKKVVNDLLEKTRKGDSNATRILGESVMAYIEENKDEMLSMTINEASEKGMTKISESSLAWKSKTGSEIWIMHTDGKLYQITK